MARLKTTKAGDVPQLKLCPEVNHSLASPPCFGIFHEWGLPYSRGSIDKLEAVLLADGNCSCAEETVRPTVWDSAALSRVGAWYLHGLTGNTHSQYAPWRRGVGVCVAKKSLGGPAGGSFSIVTAADGPDIEMEPSKRLMISDKETAEH